MDLKSYYQRLRETELQLNEPFIVIVSNETPDGGRAGIRTEVPRHIAAKMIIEDRARLATEQETQSFHNQNSEAKHAAEQLALANRMQVTLVPASELRIPKGAGKVSKD